MKDVCQNSRRDFLKSTILAGAALAATRGLSLRADTTTPARTCTSRVALTAGADRANLAFKALEPFKEEIARRIGSKRVILKPNNVLIDRPLSATHADHLEGILEFLKSIGKSNVVLAESPAAGSAIEGFANYGYNKFIGQYGVKFMEIDTEGFETLQCIDQTDFRPRPCRVSKLMTDPDNFVISSAKFKAHSGAGVTLSLKNIVVGSPIKDPGAAYNHDGPNKGKSDKPLTHGGGTHGLNYNLFTLAWRLHPALAVIDGFEGMEGDGPVDGTPVDHKVCVASLDWLAADRVAAELMGIDFSKIGYLTYCAQSGQLGEGDLAKIEILGPSLKDHIKPYKLPSSWEEVIRWQKPLLKA